MKITCLSDKVWKFQAEDRYSCCYIDDTKTGMKGVVLVGGRVKGVIRSKTRAFKTALLYDLNSRVKR